MATDISAVFGSIGTWTIGASADGGRALGVTVAAAAFRRVCECIWEWGGRIVGFAATLAKR